MTIDHINIVVRDLEANVRFYRDLLGFRVTLEVTLEGEWIEGVTGVSGVLADCVYLQPPEGPRIELLCFRRPAGAEVPEQGTPNTLGIRHIAFRVDDIEAEHARLVAAGVKFVSGPIDVPLRTVSAVSGRKRLCYFHGPENVLLELAQFVPAT